MHFRSIAPRGTALAAAACVLIATSSANAQRGGGGYGSMQSMSPTTSQTMYNTSSRATQPISRLKDPASTLSSARVEDSTGQVVGQVNSVSTAADGKASAVNVSLTTSTGAAKVVAIGVNSLLYDSDSKTLKSTLTQSQINSLPATQSP